MSFSKLTSQCLRDACVRRVSQRERSIVRPPYTEIAISLTAGLSVLLGKRSELADNVTIATVLPSILKNSTL